MQEKLTTSICIHGDKLQLAQKLLDLNMELRDRIFVIQNEAEASIAITTQAITEEGDQLRKELGTLYGIPTDELQFWVLDARYIEHGVSFLILDQERYRDAMMLKKRLNNDLEN